MSGEFEIWVIDPDGTADANHQYPGRNEGGRWGLLRVKVEEP
jgi:hypothetical protein